MKVDGDLDGLIGAEGVVGLVIWGLGDCKLKLKIPEAIGVNQVPLESK